MIIINSLIGISIIFLFVKTLQYRKRLAKVSFRLQQFEAEKRFLREIVHAIIGSSNQQRLISYLIKKLEDYFELNEIVIVKPSKESNTLSNLYEYQLQNAIAQHSKAPEFAKNLYMILDFKKDKAGINIISVSIPCPINNDETLTLDTFIYLLKITN